MNLSEIAIEKKIVTYLFCILFLLGGTYFLGKIGRLEDPDFTITKVKILVPYTGATAEEVELEVTDLIEEYIQRLPQIERVTSTSNDGLAIITADYKKGYSGEEYRQLYDELRRKMSDAQPYLPPGAGPIVVNDDFKDVYGIYYAITGEGFSQRELYEFVRDFQKKLLLVDGVSKVSVWGEPKEIIYANFRRADLIEIGINDAVFSQILQNQNIVADAGRVTLDKESLRFNLSGGFSSLDSLRNIYLTVPSGTKIRLGDIAEFTRGYSEPPSRLMSFNGGKSIGVGVSVDTTLNVVAIGEEIDKTVDAVLQETPIGMEINKVFDQPGTVEKAVSGFILSLVESVLIVTLLLLFFMGVQSGVIIGIMLTLIVASTIFFMYIFNITLQRISLGALIIAMGMLVDNSIVVTEGILVRLDKGEKGKDAALAVLKQTTWPLFGATLVAIFAFAAVGLSPDSTGEYTKTLFWVIIISLMLSWVFAITINPLICVQFMRPTKKKKSKNATQADDSSQNLEWYRKGLTYCLDHSKAVTLITIIALVLSLFGMRFVSKSFFPNSSQPQFTIDYWLPEGTDIETTYGDVRSISHLLLDKELFPEIKMVTGFAGAGSDRFQLAYGPEDPTDRYGMLLVEVYDYSTIDELAPRIQSYLDVRYLDALVQVLKFQLGPGAKGTVRARIQGDDPDELRRIAAEVKQIFNESGNAYAIRDNWGEKRKTVRVNIDEAEALQLGVSRSKIADSLKRGFQGKNIGLFRERDLLIPIVSQPVLSDRSGVEALANIYVFSEINDVYVPLAQMVDGVDLSWRDAHIQRRDRKRTIEIIADPLEGQPSELFNRVRPQVEALELPVGYTLEWGGQYEDSNNAQKGIQGTFPLAFIAMLVTIFVLWNRIKQPIIIFLSIPLSIIGMVLGLLITNLPFSFMALMGVLALFGMVIKNAIVMVDEIDIYIARGDEPYGAIINASMSRVRPVLLTALSTVLGMLPLVTDAFFQGMAVTIMFGLTIASGITLIVTPVLYALFFKIKPTKD